MIKCRDGSGKFSRDQLNDDFCDCPDGTDEPGTASFSLPERISLCGLDIPGTTVDALVGSFKLREIKDLSCRFLFLCVS